MTDTAAPGRTTFDTAQRRHAPAGARALRTVGCVLAAVLLASPAAVTAAPPKTPAAQPAAGAAAPKPAPRRATGKRYVCPLCAAQARAIGHDGRASPRRYSDLEVPTRAYTNLVVACPKCGYAAWSHDFTSPPPGSAVHYTRRYLKRTARRAATDPVLAYQHHMNLLHTRRSPLTEQVGAALFYTYVLKRRRPYGGMDPKLETRILKARKRALKLLRLAAEKSPPSDPRTRLEWQYLEGELARLTIDTKSAAQVLKKVCWARKQAGYTVGRLACEMLERAKRGETWEDYRDGVTDAREIPAAAKKAKQTAVDAKKAEAERKQAEVARKKAEAAAKAKAAEAEAKRRAAEPKGKPAPGVAPPTTKDPYAPAPPPVAN